MNCQSTSMYPEIHTNRILKRKPIMLKSSILWLVACTYSISLVEAQLVRTGFGPDAASIQSVVDQYRTDLGTVLNPNVAGSFGSGRREINWDGVPRLVFRSLMIYRVTFFNSNSPRGAVFSTPGHFGAGQCGR